MPARVNPRAVVKADSLNLQELLDDHSFHIPDYQRDFVWKESQVRQLWTDLIGHYRRNSEGDVIKTSPDAYFLGAMVVLPSENGQRLEVVDGQQRITAFTCIAGVLLDYITDLPSDDPERDGLEQCLKGMIAKYAGGKWEMKVSLFDDALSTFLLNSCITQKTRTEKEAYWNDDDKARELLDRRRSPAHRLRTTILCSYEVLEGFLAKADSDDQRKKRLCSVASLFAECLVVLKIQPESHSTAYDLFESLNYRGMPLTQADLVKNELIKAAADIDKRNDVIDYWVYMKNSLESHGTVSLPDFLHYSYICRYGHIKASGLFLSVKKRLGETGPVAFALGLAHDAENLEGIVRGDNTQWTPATNNMLRDIREVLSVKLAYPALIAGKDVFGNDKPRFERFVRLIMNFCFRYMKVLDGDVSSLAAVISEVCIDVRNNKAMGDIASGLAAHASDARFIEEFKTIGFNNTKLSYFVVYYLEAVLLAGSLPAHHGREQNLEHIMPRTPTRSAWPEAFAQREKDKDMFRDYLWRIGNLIPLPEDINKSIKNKPIDHKISNEEEKDYTHCDLKLPQEIADYLKEGAWTYDSIKERQVHLANNYAVDAWPL